MKFSIQAQISEVERELALRRGVYVRLVSSRKMKQEESDYHMGRLLAVLETLRWVEANAEELRAKATGGGTGENPHKDGGGVEAGRGDGNQPPAGDGVA